MGYKLLYFEDTPSESIKSDLEDHGFQIELCDTADYNETLTLIDKEDYDAILLDYRLSAMKGRLDAPAYASYIRTEGKERNVFPVFLITNEEDLTIIKKDQACQNLFDCIITKKELQSHLVQSCFKFNSFIEAYKLVIGGHYDLSSVLGVNEKQINDFVDFRMIAALDRFKGENDIFGYVHLIYNHFIRSIGALVGPDVLAARLGITKESLETIKAMMSGCEYKGIMSQCYERWWMPMILGFWNSLSNENPRYLTAEERVEILMDKLEVQLDVAKAGIPEESTEFWTYCIVKNLPLDPMDGFICNDRHLFEWEENHYISMLGALENPRKQDYLSDVDKMEVRIYGSKK